MAASVRKGSNMDTIINPAPDATVEDLFARDFEEGTGAVKPVLEEARLHWFNGLIVIEGGTAIGWHIRKGIDPRVDETLSAMNIPFYSVQHKTPDKDGSTAPKPYWALKSCSLVIVAQGVQAMRQMNKTDERFGIAFAWAPETDEKGHPVPSKKADGSFKKMPTLKLRAFVHEMARYGYFEWFPLTLTGYMVDELLAALNVQFRALDAYHAERLGKGSQGGYPPFFSLSIPLGPARQPKMVGEPPNLSPIYPTVADVPETVTTEYLVQHMVPKELWALLNQRDDEHGLTLVERTFFWSMDESKTLAGESALALPAPAAASAQADDPLVGKSEIDWLVHTYCQGKQETVARLLMHYQVAAIEQLRMSQYHAMLDQTKTSSASVSK